MLNKVSMDGSVGMQPFNVSIRPVSTNKFMYLYNTEARALTTTLMCL